MFGFGSTSIRKKDSKASAETQADRLRADALAGVERALLWTAGIPGTADALAYEPVQGLVAGGFMESWSVASGSAADGAVRSLGTVKVRADKICCVADMARDPYVLLGCSSGSLRIAMLVDAAGSPTTQPLQARGFTVAPYRVRPHEMCGEGEVRQLAVQSFGPIHRALVLFTAGMVSVWDLRAVELTTSINPTSSDAADYASALADVGEVTAVCWIGTERGDFATGHAEGSVLVWALPGLEPGKAAVAATMRVVRGQAEPVRMLRCVFGDVDGLLVLGGQEVAQPEGLTWIPLPGGDEETLVEEEEGEEEGDGSEKGSNADDETAGEEGQGLSRRGKACRLPRHPHTKLPWFGHIIGFSLVMDGGCITGYEATAAVLQLVEGGQLVLYNLKDQQPHMVAPYLQQRTPITVTEAPLVPVRRSLPPDADTFHIRFRPAGCSPNAITLTALRKVAEEGGNEQLEGLASSMEAFTCGRAPPLPSDATWGLLYCTGYKDGGVCLWDLHGGTTRLLCAAPAGDAEAKLKRSSASSGSVTCLHLVWSTGLLLTGHHKGEVRMYQFSTTDRQVNCITLESINTPGVAGSLHQPAGLQLRLCVQVSSGEITSLAYCQAIRAVAVGDKAGGVALVDTAKPLVRWYAMPAQNAVLACALAPLPLPPAKLRVPEVVGEDGTLSHAVVIADSEGRLAALDAARGCFIGRNGELTPKNHSYTLMLELLDESFMPIWSRRQVGAGCDQAALGGCTSGSSKGRGTQARGTDRDDGNYGSVPRHGELRRSRGHGKTGEMDGDDDSNSEEDSEAEDIDGMDVDTLLAKAAMQPTHWPVGGQWPCGCLTWCHRCVDVVFGVCMGMLPNGWRAVSRVSRGPILLVGGRAARNSPHRRRSGGDIRPREHNRRRGCQGVNDLEDATGAPAILTSCPDPAAHYMLLVTDQYLRLYSASNVMTGERSTLAKRSPAAQQQLVYARPIQVAGAPGVMALAAAEHGLCAQDIVSGAVRTPARSDSALLTLPLLAPPSTAVYSLPSLELIHEMTLSSSLSWYWDVPTGHERHLGRLAATSRLGHLLLLGLSNELLALGLAAGLPRPIPPLSLFDPAAATASLAAAASFEDEHHLAAAGGRLMRRTGSQGPQGQLQGEFSAVGTEGQAATSTAMSEMIEGMDSPIVRTEGHRMDRVLPSANANAALAAQRAAAGRVADVAKEANVALSRVFTRVQQGLSRAVEETTRGVRQLATNVEKGVATMMDGGGGGLGTCADVRGHSTEWYASQPDLGAIFSRNVPDDDEPVARLRRQQRQAGHGDASGSDDEEDISFLTITDDEDEDAGGARAATARRRDGGGGAPRGAGPPLPPRSHPAQQPPGSAAGAAVSAAARGQPRRPHPSPSSAVHSAGGEEGSLRNELFAGARPYVSAGGGGGGGVSLGSSRPSHGPPGTSGTSQPRARTADEIKRAYGRPTSAATARHVAPGLRDSSSNVSQTLNTIRCWGACIAVHLHGVMLQNPESNIRTRHAVYTSVMGPAARGGGRASQVKAKVERRTTTNKPGDIS
ncbi:R-SNARE, Tomsyn-like family [Volvox carteri f. nagariensis]|uniref:R-SNARE, Tomsyn-like family n=1 Tax=Volvox carteri f. nagariensis TaxID=3068 RepID=D8TIX8_VOLCA|nr:R-SNARE, Tomsyn-like family [Volvox carteri f. nagariensis]EFJ52444.1 R-SNARE, Tomsyn-like family [Volvox carteri f. nagariensis]|eukprot:XP_002946517.1 R-SNARE, Tomsyn-like family [Volvox carteri f. nagariensis]